MKSLQVDFLKGTITVNDGRQDKIHDLNTSEAFAAISKAMLRTGWDNKYVYSFSWLGRPIIQLPDDMIRIQELIYKIKPDVIIETGIAHGGSLVYYASILQAMGGGKVIGIDIDIRQHNRRAIENHEMYEYITMFEGSSVELEVFQQVKSEINATDKVLVFLDSCHDKDHVTKELELYSSLVSPGSYIVAMDGIMKDLVGAPRAKPDWSWNNPTQAAIEFTARSDEFIIEEPSIPFNEGNIDSQFLTYWPKAYIKRIK